jgi:hypothetical protein
VCPVCLGLCIQIPSAFGEEEGAHAPYRIVIIVFDHPVIVANHCPPMLQPTIKSFQLRKSPVSLSVASFPFLGVRFDSLCYDFV